MRRGMTAIGVLTASAWLTGAYADNSVYAVRVGANDVAALAKFYEAALGMKEVLRYGQPGDPRWEIIMRYGTTVAAAKAGSSPKFVIELHAPGAVNDSMAHAIFQVSDIGATVAAAKAAGAKMKDEIFSTTVKATGTPVKFAMFVDPEGNFVELEQRMEPKARNPSDAHP